MAQQTMFPGMVGSPTTTLTSTISGSATSFTVANGNALPEAPNLATLGSGQNAEIVLYITKTGNTLSGVTRGFQGSAQPHEGGTLVSRRLTAYDLDALRQNHEALVAQRGVANGVASLDAIGAVPESQLSNAVRLTGDTMTGLLTTPSTFLSPVGSPTSGENRIALFVNMHDGTSTNTGTREAIITLSDGVFHGTLDINLSSGHNHGDAGGLLIKRIDIVTNSSTVINRQRGYYVQASDTTRAHYSISDVYIEGGMRRIKILQNVSARNSVHIVFVARGSGSSQLLGATIGLVAPSVDTFVAPSGSNIHSSGSNANGEWVRFEDGTQICRRDATLTDNNSAGQLFTFPAAFLSTNYQINGNAASVASASMASSFVVEVQRVNSSSFRSKCLIHHATTITAPASVVCMFQAIGRWR